MPATPGTQPKVSSSARNIFWGGDNTSVQILTADTEIDSATVDAGNPERTTVLRAGLIMAKVTATGLLVQWDALGAAGAEVVYGVLSDEIDMLNDQAVAVNQFAKCVVNAPVRAENLLIQGAALIGDGDEAAARTGLNAKRFYINDEYT